MPAQSVIMLRLSLLWLFLTTIIGVLLLINKVIYLHPAIWALLPLHFEIAIWGWVVQFIMGTAYWIFPRRLEGEPRGSIVIANWMVTLYNLGLILLIAGTFYRSVEILQFIGRASSLVAILLFISIIWNRAVSYVKRSF